MRSFHGQDNHIVASPYKRKSYGDYNYNNYNTVPAAPPPASASLLAESLTTSEWQVKSGCHSSCMADSRGVQAVSSTQTGKDNIQLCTHKVKPCEHLLTPAEYAEQTCARFRLKVRGLSGHGAQISASIEEPDRSCHVGCQDEYIKYRYYLVNGAKGYFPLGTRCSQVGRRFCVYGKCLEFGADNLPLQQSHISLALFSSGRDTARIRQKRSFLYYDPVNITETITQDLLNSIVSSIIDFERQHLGELGGEGGVSHSFHLGLMIYLPSFSAGDASTAAEHIELSNPIHVSMDELTTEN